MKEFSTEIDLQYVLVFKITWIEEFQRGRIVYQQNESEPPVSFEGDFEKLGVVAGKGVLKLTPHDQIEGMIYGQILTGELKITNATYSRRDNKPSVNGGVVELQVVE